MAIFPLVYAALFLLVAWKLGGTPTLDPFVHGQRILVRLLALAGCFLAASGFERGDHLRRAWLWLGLGAIGILLRDGLQFLPPFEPMSGYISAALGVLANLALLAGIWTLARSWKMVAVETPGGTAGLVAVAVITALLALTVVGLGIKSQLQLSRGDLGSLVFLVSALVDVISLCLITPLLLTAVSLRGGLFSWPWGLITASQVCWLLYDGASGLTPLLAIGGFPLAETFRGTACNYLFVAGLAQLLVIQHVRRMEGRGAPPPQATSTTLPPRPGMSAG
ncbi:MAG: hypothetical protein M3O15_13490 [Acidobacteriota bacterium]|nr:hypothetical protein [Acidobacteriota bacterium]